MKKGQSIQFNWIFVIVAGTILLLFFTLFAFRYTTLQNKKINAETARALDRSISSIKTTEAYTNLDLGKVNEIEFNCNEFIINKDYRQKTNNIIFSSNIKSNRIGLWSKSFEYPFKIDNIVFLSSIENKIYLIYDNFNEQFVTEIYNEIPSLFNVKIVNDYDNIRDSVIVFFVDPSGKLDELKSKNNKVVYIDGADVGSVKFYEDSIKESSYLSREMMYGAIFTSNFKLYDCSFKSLLNKMNDVNKIYENKAKNMKECSYLGIVQNLNVNDEVKNCLNNNCLDLINNKEILDLQNQELYEQGCKVVF